MRGGEGDGHREANGTGAACQLKARPSAVTHQLQHNLQVSSIQILHRPMEWQHGVMFGASQTDG
jgi:hypothetical protein